jgi:hypothetical protein
MGREKQLYQQHFLDLCELAGHPSPAAYRGRNDLSAEEILEKLLALNLERAKG